MANLYKNQDENEKALNYYDKVLSVSKDNEVLSSSLLNKGLIYFNQGDIDQSILCLKEIIESYSKSGSFKGAKIGLQNAYVKKGDINEYLLYINKIPQLDISVAAKDSLIYQIAYNNFKKEHINKLLQKGIQNAWANKTDKERYAWSGTVRLEDAEIFSKAPPLASVGTGQEIGINRKSQWNNPEPEIVLKLGNL